MEPPSDLQAGVKVDYLFRGHVVATGNIVFVGGGGRVQMWGKRKIDKGKAIVRLTGVDCPGTRPPISYTCDKNDPNCNNTSWSKKHVSLGYIFENVDPPEIAVYTSSLLLKIDADTVDEQNPFLKGVVEKNQGRESTSQHTEDRGSDTDKDEEESHNVRCSESGLLARVPIHEDLMRDDIVISREDDNTLDSNENAVDETDKEDFERNCNQEWESDNEIDMVDGIEWPYSFPTDEPDTDMDAQRSRNKNDMFHLLHNLPLPQSCPVKFDILRLLTHVNKFVDVDYQAVRRFLVDERGINDDEVSLLNHFIHNKKWWRRRV